MLSQAVMERYTISKDIARAAIVNDGYTISAGQQWWTIIDYLQHIIEQGRRHHLAILDYGRLTNAPAVHYWLLSSIIDDY